MTSLSLRYKTQHSSRFGASPAPIHARLGGAHQRENSPPSRLRHSLMLPWGTGGTSAPPRPCARSPRLCRRWTAARATAEGGNATVPGSGLNMAPVPGHAVARTPGTAGQQPLSPQLQGEHAVSASRETKILLYTYKHLGPHMKWHSCKHSA